jgi:aminocarboxymuconate-semialdehyde decarboxylase
MVIDVHAHVIPKQFPESSDGWPKMEPVESGDARMLDFGPFRFQAAATFYDAEHRLAAMAADGVDAEVLSPFPPLLNYTLDADSGRDLCRFINGSIVDLCAAEPGRFFGLGTVPLQDPDIAAAELPEIVRSGLHGIEIASSINGTPLGDDRFLGFFQEAERLDVPIFVHGFPTADDRLPRSAIGSFGVAGEIALAAVSIVMGGTAEKCPELRVAFSHGAGGFPLMLTRAEHFWHHILSGPDRAPQAPTEIARRFYYECHVFDPRALRYLVEMLGPSRLMFGTDFPAMSREHAITTLDSADLPSDVRRGITADNVRRFLHIE